MTSGDERVLITGGTGLVGKYLRLCKPHNQVYAAAHSNLMVNSDWLLDVTDANSVDNVFMRVSPTAVIHTAAIGNVDWCEHNTERAYAVNVLGTENIVRACKRHNAVMVLLSTNAVFDGTKPPYGEDDIRNPLSAYGRTKVAAEDAVMHGALHDWLIVRTMLVYGVPYPGGRDTWLQIVQNCMNAHRTIDIVDDKVVCPTYATDLAKCIWSLLINKRRGVYHVSGATPVTMYEFAVAIATANSYSPDMILPISTSRLCDSCAPRPADTRFSLNKIRRTELFPGMFYIGDLSAGIRHIVVEGV